MPYIRKRDYMNEAENRLWNTIQLAHCEGCMLKINKKGATSTLGRIMKYNHNLAEKYYEFTLANGDSLTLDELSVVAVDCDIDNREVINIYIDNDDYEVECCLNDILAHCDGCLLKINGKGATFTLGRVMEHNHNLDEKYYEFTLTNGDSVTLEELSVFNVDCDRVNRVINIYIDDDYKVGCFTNDFLADDRCFQFYSIERVYENIPDID